MKESCAEVEAILKGGVKREAMLRDFDELRVMMGSAGASERFAEDIVKSLKR
jgi:lipid-A-disaccharide synthase